MFLFGDLFLHSLVMLDCHEYKLFAKWTIEVARQLVYSQISCYFEFLQRPFYKAWKFTLSYATHWFHKMSYFFIVFIIRITTALVQIWQDFGNTLFNHLIGCCFAKDHIFQMAFSMAFHLLIASVCILTVLKVINISTVDCVARGRR